MSLLSRNAGMDVVAARGKLLATLASKPLGGASKALDWPPAPGLFETCANPGCRSAWLHLWRSRSAPVFEGGWCCSSECTRALVTSAVRRESGGRVGAQVSYRHRIPLGLIMLQQNWITQAQLREALEAQRSAGTGRLGYWLMRQRAASEQTVTRALSLQWSCPVLGLENHDAQGLTSVMPRLFLDAFGALPLRLAAGKVLYLAFEENLDPVLALAIEQMTGLRVESGIAQGSRFEAAHARMLDGQFPHVELVEAVSAHAAALALTKSIERSRPVASRLVRMHDCLWLRLWKSPQCGPLPEIDTVLDVVCSIGRIAD